MRNLKFIMKKFSRWEEDEFLGETLHNETHP